MNVSTDYILGFCIGLGLVLIIALTAAIIGKRIGVFSQKYDERQKAIQGKAFKAGFLTLIGYLMVCGVFSLMLETEWCDQFTYSMIGVCLSATVFALICIVNNAYTSLDQKPKTYIIIFGGLGIANLALGIMNLLLGEMVVNGMLTFHSVNFIVGIMLLIILVVYVIKLMMDKRQEAGADR